MLAFSFLVSFKWVRKDTNRSLQSTWSTRVFSLWHHRYIGLHGPVESQPQALLIPSLMVKHYHPCPFSLSLSPSIRGHRAPPALAITKLGRRFPGPIQPQPVPPNHCWCRHSRPKRPTSLCRLISQSAEKVSDISLPQKKSAIIPLQFQRIANTRRSSGPSRCVIYRSPPGRWPTDGSVASLQLRAHIGIPWAWPSRL